jgi:DNA repair protein RadC
MSDYPTSSRLRDMAVAERPQERLQRLGPSALSDIELLAMLLRSGTRGNDVLSVATQLLAEAGSLAQLITWSQSDFRRLKGIGRVKALQLLTVTEIARRILMQQSGEAPMLDRPGLIASYFAPLTLGLQVEKFWVLCLNRKNRLIKRVEITSGIATASLAHPREVFREAIREAAVAIVCVHNHPSGDPHPSAQDMQMTRQLREAAKVVAIELADHVIIGRQENDPAGSGFYSFRAAGFL